MERFLGRFSLGAFAVLRIITGLMFASHGGQKVLGMFGGMPMKGPLPPMILVGGWIELVGGFLVAFGLFGGYAAFVCCGEMAVAYFMAHAKGGFFPIVNKGELAVLYCFVFLYIAAHGSGVVSIDYFILRSAIQFDSTRGIIATLVGGLIGLLSSYLMRPTVFGMGPSFSEWFTDGFHSPYASTIYVCVIIGLLVGYVFSYLLDPLLRRDTAGQKPH